MSLRVDKRESLPRLMNEEITYIVAVGLRNEMTMHVEVRDLGGRQKVSDLKA
jgi:hypothetical protein